MMKVRRCSVFVLTVLLIATVVLSRYTLLPGADSGSVTKLLVGNQKYLVLRVVCNCTNKSKTLPLILWGLYLRWGKET